MSFTTVDPLAALTALVYLAIAVVAVRRSGDVPLARPLAFFALGMFTYIFFEQGTEPRADGPADAIENAIASLIFIPAVELVFAFAGRRRAYRWVRFAALVFYLPLASYCFTPLYDIEVWELWMLAGLLFFFGVPGWVLVGHYRQSGPIERGRTLLLLGALLLGGTGAASTLLAAYGAPRLLDVGMIAAGLLLAALVLDRNLLRRASQVSAVTAAVFAAVVVAGEVVLFSIREETGGLFIAGTIGLVLVAFAAMRPIFAAAAGDRGRMQHLATLGCLAEQMQHDILNPLAAISGNVQYMKEEHRRGRPLEDSADKLDVILEQTERIGRIVRDYRRLSRVEPRPSKVSLSSVLAKIVAGQGAARRELDIALSVAPGVAEHSLHVDGDLLTAAVENLIRNAFEAITETETGSRIDVGAAIRGDRIAISIADDGPGMDARTIEQAREHYFTTRAAGSGLGLSYASRVAEAHGGELVIDSKEGKGTIVTLWLPLKTKAIRAPAHGTIGTEYA